MQISQLARRAGVTTKAVRYYESLGLLTPSRLANGYRDYDEHDLRLTQEIRVLNGLGLPWSALARFWSAWPPATDTLTNVRLRWPPTGTRSTRSLSGSRG